MTANPLRPCAASDCHAQTRATITLSGAPTRPIPLCDRHFAPASRLVRHLHAPRAETGSPAPTMQSLASDLLALLGVPR